MDSETSHFTELLELLDLAEATVTTDALCIVRAGQGRLAAYIEPAHWRCWLHDDRYVSWGMYLFHCWVVRPPVVSQIRSMA